MTLYSSVANDTNEHFENPVIRACARARPFLEFFSGLSLPFDFTNSNCE